LPDSNFIFFVATKKGSNRKLEVLLHAFVAGQKYGVWRDAPRRFCLSKKQQAPQVSSLLS
jgi:hypothetical protein